MRKAERAKAWKAWKRPPRILQELVRAQQRGQQFPYFVELYRASPLAGGRGSSRWIITGLAAVTAPAVARNGSRFGRVTWPARMALSRQLD